MNIRNLNEITPHLNKQNVYSKRRQCNLCNKTFSAHHLHERYCQSCKNSEEILRFSDWLPVLDDKFTNKISA